AFVVVPAPQRASGVDALAAGLGVALGRQLGPPAGVFEVSDVAVFPGFVQQAPLGGRVGGCRVDDRSGLVVGQLALAQGVGGVGELVELLGRFERLAGLAGGGARRAGQPLVAGAVA